ncbi:Pectate lyase superfamily protein [Polystyrenella longa]|uniref:Pectate lyase superfamily protein n=1 Tax=Polystyrenella longa TaxID=2528007 RepID=A0A518CSV3_9PLAN|nr:right-handed parallel beta-helix repeat-containing protein [Polystyrenella longa]QDU82285.1 Pectate lyase superfamily protein [Polystyrenella longa]
MPAAPTLETLEARCLLSGNALPISTEEIPLDDEQHIDSIDMLLGGEENHSNSSPNFASSPAQVISSTTLNNNNNRPTSENIADNSGEGSFDQLFDDFSEEMMSEQEGEFSYGGMNGVEILDDGTSIVASSPSAFLLSSRAKSNAAGTLQANNDLSASTSPESISINLSVMKVRFDVRDFGAVGDGVTDDTAALQAALDAAAGQELFLGTGTYLISDSLKISSNTRMIGEGSGSVLQFTWTDGSEGGDYYLGNKNRSDETNGDYNIELRDFKLVGGNSGNPYGVATGVITHGIFLRRVTNALVTGVEIQKTSGFAICNVGMINGKFTNNIIRDVGRDGITSFPLIKDNDPNFNNYPLDGLVISNNQFYNLGDDAIAVHAGTRTSFNLNHPPRNITITNNTIVGRITDHELGQGRGICLTGVWDATVTNNDISNTVSTGILITSWYNISVDPGMTDEAIRSDNILISSNTINGAGASEGLSRVKYGVQVKGVDRIQLLSNIIADAADRGMDIRSTTNIDVIGNEVRGALGNAAILFGGGSAYDVVNVVVRNNVLEHWSDQALVFYHVINSIDDSNLISLLT